MSRIDQISGIISGVVGVCVAVMDQTVKSLVITAYRRVTAETRICSGFRRFGNTRCDVVRMKLVLDDHIETRAVTRYGIHRTPDKYYLCEAKSSSIPKSERKRDQND